MFTFILLRYFDAIQVRMNNKLYGKIYKQFIFDAYEYPNTVRSVHQSVSELL